MSISLYEASIPALIHMLGNLSTILTKAKAHAENKKIDPAIFINARLAPDMYPLSRQIQIATDIAKGCAARLSDVDVPSYEDNEVTFDDLQARINKTIAFLTNTDNERISSNEDKTIILKLRGNDVSFAAKPYVFNFVLPNVYFHITTAYAILRHNGVELGKMDYVGGIIS